MRGPHRLRDDRAQLAAKGIEVDLVAQARAEGRQRAGRVVALAVEATIDERLDAASGRPEQCCHRERGAGDRQSRALSQRRQHQPEQQHQSEVGARERQRQHAVDERAVDDDVDVVQAVAQDRHARRERDRRQREQRQQEHVVAPRCRAGRGQGEPGTGDDRGVGEPLELLALDAARPAHAHDQPRGRQREDGQRGDPEDRLHDHDDIGNAAMRRHRVLDRRVPLQPARRQRIGERRKHQDAKAAETDPLPAARQETPGRKQQQQEHREAEEDHDEDPFAQPRGDLVPRQRAAVGVDAELAVAAQRRGQAEARPHREEDPAHCVAGQPRGDDRPDRRRAQLNGDEADREEDGLRPGDRLQDRAARHQQHRNRPEAPGQMGAAGTTQGALLSLWPSPPKRAGRRREDVDRRADRSALPDVAPARPLPSAVHAQDARVHHGLVSERGREARQGAVPEDVLLAVSAERQADLVDRVARAHEHLGLGHRLVADPLGAERDPAGEHVPLRRHDVNDRSSA
ncbi:MAG TPA: hypothetical protein VNA28_09625 [Solirubrobacteraceae bacterium]|nr:hypothetical protein [Solirubrobacteraceae bacterium]